MKPIIPLLLTAVSIILIFKGTQLHSENGHQITDEKVTNMSSLMCDLIPDYSFATCHLKNPNPHNLNAYEITGIITTVLSVMAFASYIE